MFALAGCGGSGGSAVSNSPFAGRWVGTFSVPSTADSGAFSASIATNGTLTATTHDNAANADGTVSGTIDNGGSFSGTSQYPGQPKSDLTGTFVKSGNTLTGDLTQSFNGNSVGLTVTMTKQ